MCHIKTEVGDMEVISHWTFQRDKKNLERGGEGTILADRKTEKEEKREIS